MIYCNENPKEYKEFLANATPVQRKKKVYDFHQNQAMFDKYIG
jgi:hypothetical protein